MLKIRSVPHHFFTVDVSKWTGNTEGWWNFTTKQHGRVCQSQPSTRTSISIRRVVRGHTSSCDFTGSSSCHLSISTLTTIMSTGSGGHWEHVLDEICASERERSHRMIFFTNNCKVILEWGENHLKCFTHHFLPVTARGGFPLLGVFLCAPVAPPVDTARESIATLASLIELSSDISSALTPGGIPPAPAEFELDPVKIQRISVLKVQKGWMFTSIFSYWMFGLCYVWSIYWYLVCILNVLCKLVFPHMIIWVSVIFIYIYYRSNLSLILLNKLKSI